MTLGLCMIVKDEGEVLERALSCARIFDETVVVDTGSRDGTREIARRFTDKVFDFEWKNDFAAARNFAFSKCGCDYLMWLDADDVVPPETAKGISRFARTANGEVDVVMMPYAVKTDVRGKPTFSFYRERIIKNGKNCVWRGRVHEAITPWGNIVKLPFPIVHAKPNTRSSGTRNLDIYESMKKDGVGFSARDTYYYARELYYNGRTELAASQFVEFLSNVDGLVANKIDACIMLSRCYAEKREYFAARAAVAQSFAYGPPTGEACCRLGELYVAENNFAAAAYWYGLAAKIKPNIENGAFVDIDCYGFIPYMWLTVCYDKLGDTQKAYRAFRAARKLKPDDRGVAFNERYFKNLGFE